MPSGIANTPLGKVKKGLHNTSMDMVISDTNKKEIRNQIKYSPFQSAVKDSFPELDLKKDEDLQKYIDCKKAIAIWMDGQEAKNIYTMIELENLIDDFKTDMIPSIAKIKLGEKLSPEELERMDNLFEHLTNLHKLKHGEKKIIAKMDFSFVRDLT